MRLVNGLVSGVFLLLAALVLCHLQSAPPTAALILVPAAFLTGVAAAQIVPADVERQDRVGFVATLTLLFAILLWAIDGVFTPLLGVLGPAAARAAAPLVPTVLLAIIAHRLLDFEARDWGLAWRPRPGTSPIVVAVGLILVAGAGVLEGRMLARADGGALALLAVVIAFEELLYRGFLLSALEERAGTSAAVGVQALVFTLAGGLGAPAIGTLAARGALALTTGVTVAATGWVPGVWAARLAGLLAGWSLT